MGKRRLASGAAVAAFCLAVVVVRVVASARAEYREGEVALARGDVSEAVVRLRRAARWYAPGNPYPRRALDRLAEIAARAEAAGETHSARLAWEAVRGALLGSRSLYTPYRERLTLANRHIADLMAREEGPRADPGRSEAERAAWHHALLERDDAPRPGFVVLALAGFAGWVLGALAFIYRGVGADDRLHPRAALWSAAAVVAGYAAFLLGLARA
jgi:hypothetical protein